MKIHFLRIIIVITCLLIISAPVVGDGEKNTCYNWKDIDKAEAQRLEARAEALLTLLVEIKTGELWQYCDPVLQQEGPKASFETFVHTLAERIVSLESLVLTGGKLIEIGSTITAPRYLACGSNTADSPGYLQQKIWPGIQKIAVVFYELQAPSISRRIVVVMGKRSDETFRLLSLYINPAIYFGKNTAYYQDLAETAGKGGNQIARFWFYQIAALLSQTGPIARTEESIRLLKRLQDMQADPAFRREINHLSADGRTYPIFSLSFIEIADRLVPLVAYLSQFDGTGQDAGTAEKIDAEAGTIFKVLQQLHGEVFQEFPSVMFQAYFEPPVNPQKKYPFYKVLIDL